VTNTGLEREEIEKRNGEWPTWAREGEIIRFFWGVFNVA